MSLCVQFITVDPSGTPKEYFVEGTTFSPIGSVTFADGKDASAELHSDPIRRLAEISSICNDARIVYHAVRLSLSLRPVVA